MKTQFKALALAAVLATGMAVAPALADIDDIRGLQDAKITLVDAIKTAEKHAGGQAFDASFDNDSFKPAFDVEVAKDGKSFDVRIDGVTGEVLGMREDLDD